MAERVGQLILHEAQRKQVVVVHHLVDPHDARHVRLIWIGAENRVVGGGFIG